MYAAVSSSAQRPSRAALTLFCVLLFGIAQQLFAWTAPGVVNPLNGAKRDTVPCVATDEKGTWLAVWEAFPPNSCNSDVYCSRSTDNGITWQSPVIVNSNASSDFQPDELPRLATDGNGTWMVIWIRSINARYELSCSKSTDNGQTWSPRKIIPAGEYGGCSEGLQSGGNGVWIALFVTGWTQQSAAGPLNFQNYGVSRSTDNGETWSEPQFLFANQSMINTCTGWARIACDRNGKWMVIGEADLLKHENHLWDIFYCFSSDNGATWGAPTEVNTTANQDHASSFYADVAPDGKGNWVAAWSSYNTRDLQGARTASVWTARFNEDCPGWTAPKLLEGSYIQGEFDGAPRVATDRHGTWVMAFHSQQAIWNSTDPGLKCLKISESTDLGQTWTPPEIIESCTSHDSDGNNGFGPSLTTDAASHWVMVWDSEKPLTATTVYTGFDIHVSRAEKPFPASADLALTKAAAPDPVYVGGELTYTLIATNLGNDPATGVMIVDPLPQPSQFLSAVSSQGTAVLSEGSIVAQIGVLQKGASATVTIKVKPTAAGKLTNIATVKALQSDSEPCNNTALVETLVEDVPEPPPATGSADVAITLQPIFNSAVSATQVVIKVTAKNNGPDAASGVTITDLLSSGLKYVSATATQGTVSQSNGTVQAILGGMAKGATAVLTINATLESTHTQSNAALIHAIERDPQVLNNVGCCVVEPYTPPVEEDVADMSADVKARPAAIDPNQNATFTVEVRNGGPKAATNVDVGGVLSGPGSIISAQTTKGTLQNDDRILTGSIPSMSAGEVVRITYVVKGTSPGTLHGRATVSAQQRDSYYANNMGMAAVEVRSPATTTSADVQVTKAAAAATVNVGDTVTYSITVTNAGPDAATEAKAIDRLPASLSLISATSSKGETTTADRVVTVSLGTLAAAESAVITIQAKTLEAGQVRNVVFAHARESDSNLCNNVADAVVTVNGTEPPSSHGPDLTGAWATQMRLRTKAARSSTKISAVFLAKNIGDRDAGQSRLKYYLSSDATLDSGDTQLKQEDLGTIKAGETKRRQFSANVNSPVTGKFLIAFVDANQNVAETNENNNTVIYGPLP